MDSRVAFPVTSRVSGTPGKTSRMSSADGRVMTVSAAAMMKLALPVMPAPSASRQAVAASRSSM